MRDDKYAYKSLFIWLWSNLPVIKIKAISLNAIVNAHIWNIDIFISTYWVVALLGIPYNTCKLVSLGRKIAFNLGDLNTKHFKIQKNHTLITLLKCKINSMNRHFKSLSFKVMSHEHLIILKILTFFNLWSTRFWVFWPLPNVRIRTEDHWV